MQLKTTAPSDSQTLSEVFSQMLTNDTVNQTVDDTAILDTGIGRGNVVKYSSASGKWVLCNGTVKLNSTDTVGIVEYANGTSGQVRTSGVYLDANLTSTLPYYCQSDGTLGTNVTKVFMGCIASAGRFMMVSGSGGSIQPATVEELGGVIVGHGLDIDQDGVLSTGKNFELFTSSGTFTVPTGVTTVYVTGCGGGGGSAGGGYNSPDSYYGASGGGGAACIKTAITVVPGQSYAITVGARGTAGTKTSSGGAGGATSFGALLSLPGGGGGSYNSSGLGVGGSAGGAGGSAGLSGNTLFGYGGSCIFGSHTVYKDSGAGVAGSNYGSGGAGGYNNQVGAAGSQGFMLVEW